MDVTTEAVTGLPVDRRPWHALPGAEALTALRSNANHGLTDAEARARLLQFGPNSVPAASRPGVVEIALRQLRSPLVYVLLAAAALALALGHATDAGFIGFVLLVNSSLGGWQEWNAERQSQGLQGLLRVRASVLRDGVLREIDAADLVPGDVVALESGQLVPADLRLLDSQGLEADEALLTGESLPVAKAVEASCDPAASPGDRRNCVFAATTIARGRANGLVVGTGSHTEVGRIARSLTAARAGKPPLTERMERFSRAIAMTVLMAAVVIATVAILVYHHSAFMMFTFAVALAVSAIPEGLPVAVTVALAIAARRMAGRGAIVRQLPAVEGLGSCSMIASDKTGTLTRNELTARELRLADGSRWDVQGTGYRPSGAIVAAAPFAVEEAGAPGADFAEALRIAAACNEAELYAADGTWITRGDPTDLALLALAAKGGCDRDALLLAWPRTRLIAYEPERGYAGSVHSSRSGTETWIAVKGAPERVFAMCKLEAPRRDELVGAAEVMAGSGQRVLALASGRAYTLVDALDDTAAPRGLQFCALVGLIDPLRDGAGAAVARCADAGIRVVMVTGDHPLTALAIARELGIATRIDEVVHGAQVESANAAGMQELIARARVFARVTPEQKLTIVAAAQAAGHFVAVTGDGVNDAPALRRANIGIAMGRGGTDVAREAADLVLSDDNFATIVAGVEEGRIAYQNIRNVVYLLTAAGIAEVLTVGLAVLAGLPLPLLPVQLLWLNLVTNGIQDVGLAFERGRGDELRQPPRPSQEPIFNSIMIERGVLAGTWMAAVSLGLFLVLLRSGASLESTRNTLLLLMVLMQNVDAINARSESVSVLRLPVHNNPLLLGGIGLALALHVTAMYWPWLQRILSVQPPTAQEWFLLPALAISLLLLMEAQKLWLRRSAHRG